LILVNGPPGIGKSALAHRWVSDHPHARLVEIDEIRTSLDRWQEDETTKLTARHLALDLIDHHLRADQDVIVPQYLGRTDFIEDLEHTARTAGGDLVEVLLTADEDDVVARFEARREHLAGAPHPADEVVDVPAAVAEAGARLDHVRQRRRATIVVPADHDVETTLAALSTALDGLTGRPLG